MKKSLEELQKELDEAVLKRDQCLHQQQRIENRIQDYMDSLRRKRNHRLITRGAEVESVAPEVRSMSQGDFRILVEQIFSRPDITDLVSHATDQQEDD